MCLQYDSSRGHQIQNKREDSWNYIFFLAITADILFYLKYDQTCLIVLGIGTSKVPIVIVLNKVSYSEAKN